jgi:hypothetical protein
MPLNPLQVPAALVALLPTAETWGVADDFEREALVKNANVSQLLKLVHVIDNVSDNDLFGWLSGDESFSENPTPEYLAITNLTMAIDSARAELEKRGIA